MNTKFKRDSISIEATNNLENDLDIEKDVKYLENFNGFNTLTVYSKALIHSQLFEAPLHRQMHHLYTLSEFSKLPKHTNSFVCFHDEGFRYLYSKN